MGRAGGHFLLFLQGVVLLPENPGWEQGPPNPRLRHKIHQNVSEQWCRSGRRCRRPSSPRQEEDPGRPEGGP